MSILWLAEESGIHRVSLRDGYFKHLRKATTRSKNQK